MAAGVASSTNPIRLLASPELTSTLAEPSVARLDLMPTCT